MGTNPNYLEMLGNNLQRQTVNPNLIQLLAGVGESIDPRGFGGRLGRVVQGTSRNISAQNLAAKQYAAGEADRREIRDMNRKLLERMGPITPRGTEGVNGAKETKSGSLEVDVDTGDPYKLAADLGGFTAQGSPGVNSISRGKDGSYIFDVDAPAIQAEMSLADELDDFAPGNLFNPRAQQRLSYTPVNQDQRIAEMADLMETSMPPSMLASMRTPTVPQIQYAANPSQQRADITSIASPEQIAQAEPDNLLPRRLLRQRRR